MAAEASYSNGFVVHFRTLPAPRKAAACEYWGKIDARVCGEAEAVRRRRAVCPAGEA